MHDEKQETEREQSDLEKSAENLSEGNSIVKGHSDVNEDDDMDMQLNPEAAEFVPTSPPASAPLSPFSNGTAAIISSRPDLLEDDLLAQSPRKSVAPVMEDFALPSENDFSEISKRPSELLPTSPTGLNNPNGEAEARPGSSSSQCSYQEMNLKEAMHGDEKQELAAEVSEASNLNAEPMEVEIDLLQGNVNAADVLIRSLREQDPMHMSFYNDRNENGLPQTNPFAEPEVDMNAVQTLPDSDDEAFNERDDFEIMVSSPVIQNHGEQQPTPELIAEFGAGVPLSSLTGQFCDESVEIPVAENDLINVNESSPITQVVQEMASEVTSILNEIDEHHHNAEQLLADHHSEFEMRDASNDGVADVINKSDLSAAASEFRPSQLIAETTQSPVDAAEELVSIVEQVSAIQPVEPFDVPVAPVETQQHEEPKVDLLAAAGVATATAIAAAVVATAKSLPEAMEPKVTAATKKPATLAAKKPAGAPLKTTSKAAVSTTRTSASSPSKTLAAKVTTAAPKPPVRTVKAPIEKKTNTVAAKKPASAPLKTTLKPVVSTSRTSVTSPLKTLASKVTAAAPKPSVQVTKTTTSRTTTVASSAAPAKTSTLSKPATTAASARVPLSAR